MKKQSGGKCGKCGKHIPCDTCYSDNPLGDKIDKGWAAYWKNKNKQKEA